jgi:hypothetical protein
MDSVAGAFRKGDSVAPAEELFKAPLWAWTLKSGCKDLN